jgi:hypothetical protein
MIPACQQLATDIYFSTYLFRSSRVCQLVDNSGWGPRYPVTTADKEPKMSTDPVRNYVSYLSTNTLARCVADIEAKLSTARVEMSGRQRELLVSVHGDLMAELNRRQLHFPEDPGQYRLRKG